MTLLLCPLYLFWPVQAPVAPLAVGRQRVGRFTGTCVAIEARGGVGRSDGSLVQGALIAERGEPGRALVVSSSVIHLLSILSTLFIHLTHSAFKRFAALTGGLHEILTPHDAFSHVRHEPERTI
jgi:hypothetical protein